MLNYIYDFLSILFDKLKDKEAIKAIILFGSVARGAQRKDSDIDLFIDVKKSDIEKIRPIVQESLNEFELKAARSWHLKGIDNPLVPLVGALADARWSELHKEIASTGIVLYGVYQAERIGGKHAVLITYELKRCKQKQKMKILRTLYGYTNKKGKKKYVKEGLAASLRGEKIQNAILIGIASYKSLIMELRECKIPYTTREIWLA